MVKMLQLLSTLKVVSGRKWDVVGILRKKCIVLNTTEKKLNYGKQEFLRKITLWKNKLCFFQKLITECSKNVH